MKTKLFTVLSIAALSLCWMACDDTTENNTELPKDSLVKVPPPQDDKDKNKNKLETPDASGVRLNLTAEDKATLAVLDEKLLGLDYNALKAKFPQLKGIHPEDYNMNLANDGFTESITEMKLINKKVKVKFNFRKDTLYKFSLSLNETDAARADLIFNGLVTQYSDTFGSPALVPVEEDNHYFKSYKWPLERSDANITHDLNKGDIVWGIQRK